jgi:hypothetical protein
MFSLVKKSVMMVMLCGIPLFYSCTAVNHARTVGKGQTGMEISLGGPITTTLGVPIPVPNLFLGGRHGIRDDLDISAHVNLFTPVMPGIALDLITGVDWIPIQPGIGSQAAPDRGWGTGIALDIQWLTDFEHGLVVLPSFEIPLSLRYRWFSVFAGSGLGLNFYRPYDKFNFLQVCPFLGGELIGSRWSVGLKVMAYDIFYNLNGAQANWVFMIDEQQEKRQRYAPLGIGLGIAYEFKTRRTGGFHE